MSTSILQNNGLQSLSWQQVTQSQIMTRVSEELQKETAKVEEKYDSQNVLLDAQSQKLASLKAGINNAEIAVDNGEDAVKEVKDALLKMRILLGNYPESDDKEQLRTDFDEYVDKINRSVNLYAKAYNPVGNVVNTDWTPNTISYERDQSSNRTEMTGTYIGSSFYIEAEDGTMWVADPGSSSIQQYEIYKTDNVADSTKGDGFASTRSGLYLNSYNEETGEITVTVDPENNPKTVTGTIHKGGTELMQSWFYDLDTEDGRAKALAAIDRADALVVGAEATLTGMKATIANDSAKVQKELELNKEKRGENLTAQMTESYELQVQKQQELQILQNTFSQMAAQQANYSKIFKSVNTNPLLDVIT